MGEVRWTRLCGALSITILLIGAGAWTLTVAGAEWVRLHSSTPRRTEEACRWTPADARCWATLARQKEELGRDARADWARSLALDPRDAATAMQAALAQEAAGHAQDAEAILLQAARHSQLWLPRWTLTGYYLRHRREEEFWPWVRLAFERSYGDRTALFRLCRQAGGSNRRLLDEVLPPDAVLRAEYLHYLIMEGTWEDLEPAALACLPPVPAGGSARVVRQVTEAVDALVQSRHPEPALRLWDRLAAGGHIPYGRYRPAEPLTNAELRPPLDFAGFDWRLIRQEGVEALWGAPPETIKLVLSGRQRESAPLLEQAVWLPAGTRFRLRFETRVRGMGEAARGLTWTVADHRTGEVLAALPSPRTDEEWVQGEVALPAQAARRLVRIVVSAERPAGRTRLEGEVWIRRPRLEQAS